MNESGNTRRDFVKKAAYVAPAILTLAAVPSYAKFGSDKLEFASSSNSIAGASGTSGISSSRNTSVRSYLNNRGNNGNRIGNSNSSNALGNNGNGLANNGNGLGSNRNALGNNGNGLGNNGIGDDDNSNSGNNGITGNAGQNAQSPLHSSALANYRARHGLPTVISPPSD